MTYEILCGIHSVSEALKAKKRVFSKIYISKDRNLTRLNDIIELAEANNRKPHINQLNKIDIEFVSANHLDHISNGVKHQGVTAKVSPFPLKKAEDEFKNWDNLSYSTNLVSFKDSKKNSEEKRVENRKKFIVVLESIEDTHNLGAIIRTAICAGVDHIIIPKDRAVQPSPAVSRVSAGAMEHADIHIVTNVSTYLKNLKKKGFWIAGLDADGDTSLFSADLTDNIALVVGGEHQGIRPIVKKECDFLLSIPIANLFTSKKSSKQTISTFNSKEEVTGITSLNASVACSIAMYEVLRQRR